ncbi:EAL domain-containing protein [Altererythrobacter sp. BO-6]|uniref:EAL domain-containing protein n=1 Tax=Altererythrobacter sp. BO-6 TaxID=2604537 RepID=UPI0013E19858|nr:EAL domain-containing protein [Altererythrobacter sp. BO-6]QIG52927.1 EAL domain-containing protein [Altererythrobacter sp. BO-6]
MLGRTPCRALCIAAAVMVASMQPVAAHAQGDAFEAKIAEAKSSMMADSSQALRLAREAGKLATGTGSEADEARLTAKWLEGEALMRLNRASEAAEIISSALSEAEKSIPDSKLYADLLRSQGSIAAISSDYAGALSAFLKAHQRYNLLGEKRSEAIVLQHIGSLYSDARDYERVLRYYRQATATFPEDDALSLSAHNNKGNALKELGRFEEAEEEFRSALKIAEKMESPLLEARILNNIASVQMARGRLAAAEETANTVMAIARRDAPEWVPFINGVRSQIALARGDLKRAEAYLSQTFAGQNLTQTIPYFRDFHQTAYETFRRLGNYRLAAEHMAAFNRLDSQARDLSAKANNAILGARFEAAEREVRIARLSADKQAKEAQLAAQNNQLIALSGGIALALLLILGGLFVLRNIARSRAAIAAANEKLTYVTQHDSLTGLYSRDYFRSLLDQQLELHARSEIPSVLMLVDLDRFKQVNDVYGHAAGDKLLSILGERFRKVVGAENYIGRLGGDEFAIVLTGVQTAAQALPIAHKLIEEVSEAYLIDGFEMNVGASIGIAVIGADGQTNSDMMTNADLALYDAKRRGRGTAVVYSAHMRMQLEDKAELEADLADALKNDELSIHYQPIVRGAKREVMYYEALMRWNHPVRGMIPPSVFIPIAEDTLMIEHLGSWMLRSACKEAASWPENIKLTVNISALQLSTRAFLGTVVEAMAASGIAADRLVLEVTETMLLEMDEDLDALLTSLSQLGVCFALDDFGRGYSSLSYIEKIRFSMIKIDRSFVQSAATGSRRSEAIVAAIVSLARSLDIDVTAEGIEEEEQMSALEALGCACFQGFHIGHPMPYIEQGALLVADNPRKVA